MGHHLLAMHDLLETAFALDVCTAHAAAWLLAALVSGAQLGPLAAQLRTHEHAAAHS